jgi:hypothetical protein
MNVPPSGPAKNPGGQAAATTERRRLLNPQDIADQRIGAVRYQSIIIISHRSAYAWIDFGQGLAPSA